MEYKSLVLFLCVILVKTNLSLRLKKKSIVLDRYEDCDHTIKSPFTNFTIVVTTKDHTSYLDIDFEVTRYVEKIKMVMQLIRCSNKDNLDSCAFFTNLTVRDTCSFIKQKSSMLAPMFYSCTPYCVCPFKQNNTETNTEDLGKVKQLYIETQANVHNSNQIALNVTIHNLTDELITKLSYIKITTITGLVNTSHCEKTNFKESLPENLDILLKNSNVFSTSIQLTEDIYPGCTYNISLINSNGRYYENSTYKVPECVETLCVCYFFSKKPEAPEITVEPYEKDTIRINWSQPKMDTEIYNTTNITFVVSNSASTVYAVVEEPVSEACRLHCSTNVSVPNMHPGAMFHIRSRYMYPGHCPSEIAHRHLLYQGPIKKDKNEKSVQEMKESQIIFQVLVCLMFTIILLSLLWFSWKYRMCCQSSCKRARTHMQINGGCVHTILSVPMEVNNLYTNNEVVYTRDRSTSDKYEISYNDLQFEKQIGSGEFGQVFKARVSNLAGVSAATPVAVKTLEKNSTHEDYEEFRREIAILKQIGQHPHIVKLLGCCTLRQPYCIVMEYIPCGDLLRYLRAMRTCFTTASVTTIQSDSVHSSLIPNKLKHSLNIPLNRLPSINKVEYTALEDVERLDCVFEAEELQHFAIQIARAMRHLESKQIVHRDLAARNILIDEKRTLKISDFGLSRRGIYVNSKQHRVPLRWLSVEAIRDNLYTNKSDVWSYGVVLWEIGTLGGFPYIDIDDSKLFDYLASGKRLEKPENCTQELYALMQRCWLPTLDERPSFHTILEELDAMSRQRHVYVDFAQLNPTYMFPPLSKTN